MADVGERESDETWRGRSPRPSPDDPGRSRALPTLTWRRLPSLLPHSPLPRSRCTLPPPCRLPSRCPLLSSSRSLVLKQVVGEAGYKARLTPPYCDSAPGLSRGWVAGFHFNLAAISGAPDTLAATHSTPRRLLPLGSIPSPHPPLHQTCGRGWHSSSPRLLSRRLSPGRHRGWAVDHRTSRRNQHVFSGHIGASVGRKGGRGS